MIIKGATEIKAGQPLPEKVNVIAKKLISQKIFGDKPENVEYCPKCGEKIEPEKVEEEPIVMNDKGETFEEAMAKEKEVMSDGSKPKPGFSEDELRKDKEQYTYESLKAFTRKEQNKIAKELGIKVKSKWKEADIIKAILKAQK